MADVARVEEGLFELLERNSTVAELQSLLRIYKEQDKDNVRISAVDKKGVLANLKKAVSARAVPLDRVQQLASESEENGGQHIFYYVPLSAEGKMAYSDGESIARKLLGVDWRTQCQFPQYRLDPSELAWGDFRVEQAASGEPTWTAKIYSQQMREKQTQETKENGRRSVVFEEVPMPVVLVAKYHSFGLLELRVPRWENRDGIESMLQNLWMVLADAVPPEDFEPWDLTRARTRILDERDKHIGQYRISDLRLMGEDGGKVTVSSQTVDGDVFKESGRAAAIATLLKSQSECEFSAVIWLKTEQTDSIVSNLVTLIGTRSSNEMVVRSRTTASAIDYVTYRLRQFASAT